jgi:hypothetical protein
MKRTTVGIGIWASAVAATAVLGLAGGTAAARRMMIDEDFIRTVDFALLDTAIGGRTAPTEAPPAYLAGSPLAALPAREALVIDADSGRLIRVGADGKLLAELRIGADASQLVYDAAAGRAYVADRRGDRIAVVTVGDTLTIADSYATAAEPYGVALTPDARALLVTTVADHAMLAFDTATGKELWRHELDVEPRGIAIAPDGKSALVTYLNTGTVERIALRVQDGVLAAPAAGRHIALNQGATAASGRFGDASSAKAMKPRAAFAARFIGNGLAITAHQMSTPEQTTSFRENTGSYGGGFDPPVTHRVAFLGSESRFAAAEIGVHQPQAVGYRAADDTAFIAGLGSDEILILADASQASVRMKQIASVRSATGDLVCGPTGVAPALGSDDEILVWCSMSRRLARITLADGSAAVVHGDRLSRSRYSVAEHKGMELFFSGDNTALSSRGSLACGSCHPEGRADGLSWRIEKQTLQTPVLSGRIAETHPFKWDGGDATLEISLTTTVKRLGGFGISADDAKALAAFIEAMPAPRAPTTDRRAVARGARLFASDELGCASCHAGTKLTDRARHDVETDLPEVDTPSLVGLAVSAPYYHDGSAATLEAVLLENGSVHAMGNPAALADAELDDLVAYLKSL